MSGKLAIHGGNKVKNTPFGTGKRFGDEEAKELMEALNQNTLFYHTGKKVKTFLHRFNEMYGTEYSVAVSSGTAALHVALGAAGITVGDEVITSPITDQGTVIGIMYQNAIPVFADLELDTYNMNPEAIESCITSRTKAIIVVHLAGNPANMEAIMRISEKYQLKVIEDCAQSYLASYKGKYVGTIGDYGCFSTNDFKHISTGDGGIVTINSSNEHDYHVAHAFADKNYQRIGDGLNRDLSYLAPNYRMTELQGAVGIAQLSKLKGICSKRTDYGNQLTEDIQCIDGILPHKVQEQNVCTYWFYMFRIDLEKFSCSRDEFAYALRGEGIPATAGYIPQALYKNQLFQNRSAYRNSTFPISLTDTEYKNVACPNAERILKTAIRLPISEFYSNEDIEAMISGIRKVAAYYRKDKITLQVKKGETYG